ncbi:unnamed protein product [Clavelina lepadiformis]|uniref:Uncharacterized protein n=1 Tax=Clavelina lepadiformis TaxID=159417 RepID=A0ABP0F841_CLALP
MRTESSTTVTHNHSNTPSRVCKQNPTESFSSISLLYDPNVSSSGFKCRSRSSSAAAQMLHSRNKHNNRKQNVTRRSPILMQNSSRPIPIPGREVCSSPSTPLFGSYDSPEPRKRRSRLRCLDVNHD